jgi:hypothetical protein
MSPLEKNSRKLVGVMIGFPDGACSADLRQQFQAATGLERQSYFYALREAKRLGWIIGGGGRDQLYVVDYEAFSKAPESTGSDETPPLEQFVEESQGELATPRMSNGGVAVSSLVEIVGDPSATLRQKLRASATVLGYRVQDAGVIEFVKRFLERLCANARISADYRVEAAEQLRRCQDPKIMPQIQRPDLSPPRDVDPAKEQAERDAEFLRKKAYVDAATAAIEREYGPQARARQRAD